MVSVAQERKEMKETAWLLKQLETISTSNPEDCLVSEFSAEASYSRSRQRFLETVRGAAAWLTHNGIKAGDSVAIDSVMRFEAMVMWCACCQLGAIAVFYPEDMRQSSRELDASQRAITVVLAETPRRAKNWFDAASTVCKKIRHILYVDERNEDRTMIDDLFGWPLPKQLTSFESFVNRYAADKPKVCAVLPSSPCAVYFSQGKKDSERPFELTYSRLEKQAQDLIESLSIVKGASLYIATRCIYAPMLVLFATSLLCEGSIVLSIGDKRDLLVGFEQPRTNYVFAFPTQIHQIVQSILHRSSKVPFHERWNNLCVTAGKIRNRTTRPILGWSKKVIDNVFLRHLKNRLGTDCRAIVSFGAPFDPHDAEFFTYLDTPVYNAYTVSEAGGFAHIHRFNQGGSYMKSCETEIRRGVLYIRTEDSLLSTEDFVFEDERIGLCVHSEASVVLDSGQKIDTTSLKENLISDPIIDNVFIFGMNKPYLTALVYLNEESLRRWCLVHKLDTKVPFTTLTQYPKVYEYIRKRADDCCAMRANNEDLRKIAIIPTTIGNDPRVLTESGMVRRNEAAKKYINVLNSFYTEIF